MTTLVAAEAALEAAAQAAEKGAPPWLHVIHTEAGLAADPFGLPAGDPRAPEMLQLAQDQFDAAGGFACVGVLRKADLTLQRGPGVRGS